MFRKVAVFVFAAAVVITAIAQKKSQPWNEWSKKDAEKMLNNSAWAQTQSDGEASGPANTSAVTAVAASGNATRDLSRTGESGENKPSTSVKYRVRFLSAKPVRQAFARMLLLTQEKQNEQLSQDLQGFIDRDFADYIIVAVTAESADKKIASTVAQAFMNASLDKLKNSTYLERKDGRRLFLMDYRAPTNDGIGAKFVFSRSLEGRPFLNESENVRFIAELSEKVKLNVRYKLADMTYDGKLEY